MKTATFLIAAAIAGLAVPAMAEDITTEDHPQVVDTNAAGKITKVRVAGETYEVCMTEQQQDNCIQPRAAGLDWGDVPLAYWPGEPASAA